MTEFVFKPLGSIDMFQDLERPIVHRAATLVLEVLLYTRVCLMRYRQLISRPSLSHALVVCIVGTPSEAFNGCKAKLGYTVCLGFVQFWAKPKFIDSNFGRVSARNHELNKFSEEFKISMLCFCLFPFGLRAC